jgi:transcriptional regulator with XRE-family HTH domain
MVSEGYDYEALASELLRALRGARSQTQFARRLGYKSNVVYSWEAGRAFPTAATALRAAERAGADVPAALLALYRQPPREALLEPATPAGVAQFLDDLRGRASVQQLARMTGFNRYAIARWLKGSTEPRLPDFLRLLEAMTLRLIDWLAALVDPEQLPSVRSSWRELELARAATYREPWSQAVLRALELAEYRALPRHEPGWVARRLGLDLAGEQRALELLLATGQVRRTDARFEPVDDAPLIDTRRDPRGAWQLRVFWSEVALARLRAGSDGLFSHAVVGVSETDLAKIRELQKAYYQEVRAIVAGSQPVERVALLNLQLVPLA